MSRLAEKEYYSKHEDSDFWQDAPATEPQEFDFHTTPAPPKLQKKGRHQFTSEERERGWTNAKLSVDARFPDARCQHGASLSHCLLRVKHPGFDAKSHHITKPAF